MKTILLSFTICLVSVYLNAQPGTLDYSFGDSGKVLNKVFTGDCRTIAIQKDGKIITGGEDNLDSTALIAARFNIDGSIDSSFGTSGKTLIRHVERRSQAIFANSLAIQPDEKILICAHFITFSSQGAGDIGLIRLNKDGALDESFGDSGIVVTSLGLNDVVGAMTLQQDGKILVTGNKGVKANQLSPAFIIRYLPDGNMDNSFGTDGVVYKQLTTDFNSTAIKINKEGKILIGGVCKSPSPGFAVLQYNADGSLNENFGVGGIATLSPRPGNLYSLNDLAIQNDSNILITGSYGTALVLARFDKSGKIDSGFGKERVGYVTVLPQNGYARGKSVYSQSQNIIVTGICVNGPNTGFGAFSFKANGNVDFGFGNNGIATSGFNVFILTTETGKGAIEPDGKIVVGGGAEILQTDKFLHIALVRFDDDNATKNQITINKTKHCLQTDNNATADISIHNITLYPNPVNNVLTIKELDIKMNYELSILNDKGSAVATKQVNNISSYQFNVQNLSSGVYYVNVFLDNKIITTLKFVKE